MKIAVPSETDEGLESVRSGHFGHAPYMTLVTLEGGAIKSVEVVKNADHDAAGCGGVIEHVLSLGIDGILAVGMGRPPLARFTENGVRVYAETETPKVGDAVRLFAAGKVQSMDPDMACNHH